MRKSDKAYQSVRLFNSIRSANTAGTAVQRRAPVVARHRREHMRADPLVGIEDRDRHAVERGSPAAASAVDPDVTRRLGTEH
jgi:hypothetical protein